MTRNSKRRGARRRGLQRVAATVTVHLAGMAVLGYATTARGDTAFVVFPDNYDHISADVLAAIAATPTSAGTVYDASGNTTDIPTETGRSPFAETLGPVNVSTTLQRLRNDQSVANTESDDGGFFNFYVGELPNIPRMGMNYYMEFVVWPTMNLSAGTYNQSSQPYGSGETYPGAIRILVGSGGEVYYTGDHYSTNDYVNPTTPLPAITINTWNTTNGSWSTAGNWDTGTVPVAGQAAYITVNDDQNGLIGTARVITYDYTGAAVTLGDVLVNADGQQTKQGSTTFNQSQGTLTTAKEEVWARYATAIVNETGGTVAVNGPLHIGEFLTSTGTYNLSSTGSLATTDEYIGSTELAVSAGTGKFNQSGGTHTVSDALNIGDALGGTGVYTMTLGTLTANNVNLNAGGTLNQSSGTVTVSNTLTLNTSSTLILSIGMLAVNTLATPAGLTGFNWTGGTLSITGTSNLSIDNASTAPLGSALVLGSAQSFSVPNTLLYVGNVGTGSLTQTGTGTVTIGTPTTLQRLVVGYAATSVGTYTLNNSSAILQMNGNEFIGYYATGTSSGGVISQYGGTFTQTNGTNNVTLTFYVGRQSGSTGEFVLGGGNLNVYHDAYTSGSDGELIGDVGTGLFIQSGGTNTVGTGAVNQNLFLGWATGSIGTYVMNGSSASLTVNGGAYVGGNTATGGVGMFNMSSGTALFNGLLKVWDTSGTSVTQTGGTVTAQTIQVGSIAASPAVFNFSGGTLKVTSGFTNYGTTTLAGTQNWSTGSTFTNMAGTTTFSSNAGSTSSATLSVNVTGGTIDFSSSQNLVGLMIGSGSTVQVTNPLATKRSVITAATLSDTGTLDLGGENLDVASGSSVLTNVSAMVKTGYNGGSWNGTGITSSIAALDSSHLHALGVATSGNYVQVEYTYYGDANLDGQVDGSDYSKIDNGFHNRLTGWYNGDFNYDSVIDGSDYTLIDNAFNTQGLPLDVNSTALVTALIAGSSSVPEPSMMALPVAGLILGLSRRSRGAIPKAVVGR